MKLFKLSLFLIPFSFALGLDTFESDLGLDSILRSHQKIEERMREEMKSFFQRPLGMNSLFIDSGIKISHKEDDQYKIIEIEVDGLDKESLKIDIAEGMITLSGRVEKEYSNQSNYKSYSSSSFSRSFNVPAGVDERSAKIETENDKIIVKFMTKRA